MKLRFRIATATTLAILSWPVALIAQTSVPLRTLSEPIATSAVIFGAIESVRALNGNGLLVNDSRNRQLIVLDSTLSKPTTLLDSATNNRTHYGSGHAPLIPYLADSTLFRDIETNKFLVIDPTGVIDHRLERTKPGETPLMLTQPRGFDLVGNPIMPALVQNMRMRSSSGPPSFAFQLVRANYATREQEPITQLSPATVDNEQIRVDAQGNRHSHRIVNPLPIADDWVVLSDGTLAVVRVSDYRVEMFNPVSKDSRSIKLPHEKRSLNDDDKRKMIDSANAALIAEAADPRSEMNTMAAAMGSAIAMADSARRAGRAPGSFTVNVDPAKAPIMTFEFVPLNAMQNELPPFRIGQIKADLDAHLWIPTNNRSAADPWETIYDVVSSDAKLIQRVRVPAGRSIVGFARGGFVYLKSKRASNQWIVERVRVID